MCEDMYKYKYNVDFCQIIEEFQKIHRQFYKQQKRWHVLKRHIN